MLRLLPGFIAFLALASCSAADVRTEHDEAIHARSWRTWAFAEGPRSAGSARLRSRLAAAIGESLSARGLAVSREAPDLLVRAGLSTATATTVSPYGHGQRTRPTPERGLTLVKTERVLLVIEMLANGRDAPLWRGEAETAAEALEEDPGWVDRTVAALLADFPPPP